MPLETASYIHDLVTSNPPASDGISQGDDHLRLVKSVLKNQFPNFTAAALNSTQAELDAAAAFTTAGAGVLADTGAFFKSDPDTGLSNPVANELDVKVGGVVGVKVTKRSTVGDAEVTGNATVDGNGTVTGDLTVTGKINGPGSVPIGGTVLWWSNTLPADGNWAFCNGQFISRTTYATLFSILGVTYGDGNHTNTFTLPDLRDNVPVGLNTMGGTTAAGRITTGVTGGVASTLGKQIGEDQHLLIEAELAAHKHTITDPGHTHDVAVDATNTASTTHKVVARLNGLAGATLIADAATLKTTGITVNNDGGDTKHNNVQPSLVCNWIIRIL